jgi:hypothetical protein
MLPELFIVWLRGYLAATGDNLTPEQIKIITTQLDTVQLRGPYRSQPTTPTA